MKLYHRTTTENAEVILRDGFLDGNSAYGTGSEWSGVWLSDVPLDAGDIAYLGTTLLRVTLRLSEGDIDQFEWVEESKIYREWLIPAHLISANSTIEILDDAAEDAIFNEMQAKREARAFGLNAREAQETLTQADREKAMQEELAAVQAVWDRWEKRRAVTASKFARLVEE